MSTSDLSAILAVVAALAPVDLAGKEYLAKTNANVPASVDESDAPVRFIVPFADISDQEGRLGGFSLQAGSILWRFTDRWMLSRLGTNTGTGDVVAEINQYMSSYLAAVDGLDLALATAGVSAIVRDVQAVARWDIEWPENNQRLFYGVDAVLTVEEMLC